MTRGGWALMLLVLALVAPACSFPGLATPTPFVLPTPNLTLTAIFEPPSTLGPPVFTPTPVVVAPPATNTPTPTAVGASTATPGAGSSRPNGTPVRATRLNVAPTLDGNLTDWSGTVYAADQIVFGASRWSGQADVSGSYYIGWDAANLYLAISVRDDKHVQRASGAKMYLGDDVELQLDLDLALDYTSPSLSSDDVQLGFSPGDFGARAPEAYRWYPLAQAGRLSSATVKARVTDQGYTLEAGNSLVGAGYHAGGRQIIRHGALALRQRCRRDGCPAIDGLERLNTQVVQPHDVGDADSGGSPKQVSRGTQPPGALCACLVIATGGTGCERWQIRSSDIWGCERAMLEFPLDMFRTA